MDQNDDCRYYSFSWLIFNSIWFYFFIFLSYDLDGEVYEGIKEYIRVQVYLFNEYKFISFFFLLDLFISISSLNFSNQEISF